MTNETKHTPTPLPVFNVRNHVCIYDKESYIDKTSIALCDTAERAAHIVKCVNMHDELVESLLRMKQWCEDEVGAELPCSSIDKVLKKAGAI